MTARETTVNMFAATDIVIAKLKTQLEKYRASHREHGKGETKSPNPQFYRQN